MRESASSTMEASPDLPFPLPCLGPEHLRLQGGKELQRIHQHSPVLRAASSSAQHPFIHLRERIPSYFLGVSALGGDGRGKCFESQYPARSGEEEPETSLTLNSNCTNRDGAEERARGTSQVTVAQLGWESGHGFYQGLPAEGRIRGLRPWEAVETCTPGSRSLPSPKGTQHISPLPSQTEAEAEAHPGRRGRVVSSRN